jgi:YidC/Oxa1 family membrane protein insertase
MLTHIFTLFIYQPFLNLLVGIYWLLQQLPIEHNDMGVAVILFTIALRFILLPITLASSRSDQERRAISLNVKEIRQQHKADPVRERSAIREHMRSNPKVVISTLFNLSIQIAIAIMLWRIFARGLLGEDLHLIYPFMPEIDLPFDLRFWNKFDLTHPSFVLNVVQSLVIFLLETVRLLTDPYPTTRKDAVRMQIVIPVIAFLIFSLLPAGKKLFVITTLLFSLIFTIVRVLKRGFDAMFTPKIILEQEST